MALIFSDFARIIFSNVTGPFLPRRQRVVIDGFTGTDTGEELRLQVPGLTGVFFSYLETRPGLADNEEISLAGTTVRGKGQGRFAWRSGDTTTPVYGMIAAATGGRWHRLAEGNVKPEWFGALADGTTDDYAAFQRAISWVSNLGGGSIELDRASYKIGTGTLEIPNNVHVFGKSREASKLIHAFDGHMFIFRSNMSMTDLSLVNSLKNDGITYYSGDAIRITGTDSNQTMDKFYCTLFDGRCVYFEIGAGSGCSFSNFKMFRSNAASGTGRYAIVVEDAFMDGAVPRKFVHGEFGGQCSVDFGGCNNFFMTDCYMADVRYSSDSRGVQLKGVRIGNQSALTISGHNNTIVGSDINPTITLSSGTDNCVISDNTYNHLPIVDNSGNNRNLISHYNLYAPTIWSPELRRDAQVTPSGGNTSPSVAGWTGYPLRITVASGGVLGVGTYTATINGTAIVTGATLPADGTDDITYRGSTAKITFASGTYVLADYWDLNPERIWENTSTKSGAGPDISGYSASGFPIYIRIDTGGTLGNGSWRWSADAGTTWQETGLTLPSTGTAVITCGGATATLTFAAGTYVANDTYTFTVSSVIGTYTRHASLTTVVVTMYFATGATFNTFNQFKVSLPYARQASNLVTCPGAYIVDASASKVWDGFGLIAGVTDLIELRSARNDGSEIVGEKAAVTKAMPITFAAGDFFSFTATYTN